MTDPCTAIMETAKPMTIHELQHSALSIVVLGASGDLARKKTFPALFGLFIGGVLPKHVSIVGYARRKLSSSDLQEVVRSALSGHDSSLIEAFLARLSYFPGPYGDVERMRALDAELQRMETEAFRGSLGYADETVPVEAHRLFYFALPPSVYGEAARSVYEGAWGKRGWSRVVIEKPFGHDSASCDALVQELHNAMDGPSSEKYVYRIDHYLGKEIVQSMFTLRFANRLFEPMWNREHVSCIQITFKEPFGTKGRGGYFDKYGIIRDVMQNHLMQVLALVAMEAPTSAAPDAIAAAKVEALRCISADIPDDHVVLGQYGPHPDGDEPAYWEDESIDNKNTCTPTYCAAVLFVDNDRWRGVPFIMKAGKALNERKTEVRMQLRPSPHAGMFASTASQNNELVIKIQPGEAVYVKCLTKAPGLSADAVEVELDLSYASRFPCAQLPDAYERLILEALRGDRSNFVGQRELEEAWRIFTPLLHRIDARGRRPLEYKFGSRGPVETDVLVERFGYRSNRQYRWLPPDLAEKGVTLREAMRERMALPLSELRDIVDGVRAHMEMGLRGDSRASIKMIPSFVDARPSTAVAGTAFAVDLGGTNFRLIRVHLGQPTGREPRCTTEDVARLLIPDSIKHGGSADQLFDWMASAIQLGAGDEAGTLGFTFSFPVQQTALASGTLIHWTKDWAVEGVVGTDLVSHLNDALARRGSRVRVNALVNDTVGTLMSGAMEHSDCTCGVILGTGSNAAYMERTDRIAKWTGDDKPPFMIVNTEWGGFDGVVYGDDGSQRNVLPRTEVDRNIDLLSESPGQQLFEKMISGRTLGEILRRCLMNLQSNDELWQGATRSLGSPVTEQHAVDSAAVSCFLSAQTEEELARAVEEALGVQRSSAEDLRLVQEVAQQVTRRAARLAAAGVAACVFQMQKSRIPLEEGGSFEAHKPYKVGIDGSLFAKMDYFRDSLNEALAELSAPCETVVASDGSGLGAGLISVTAASRAAPKL